MFLYFYLFPPKKFFSFFSSRLACVVFVIIRKFEDVTNFEARERRRVALVGRGLTRVRMGKMVNLL